MTCDLEPVRCDAALHRVGFAPNPWAFTDWRFAEGGRFRGRWDDPEGDYRVLYAASTRLGAYLEALAPFRPDPEVLAAVDAFDIDEKEDLPQPLPPLGYLPQTWLRHRVAGSALVTGVFADVGHSRSLAYLRSAAAPLLIRYRITDLDGAAIRLSAPREFTQHLSRLIYHCVSGQGTPQFDGTRYLSRLGDDIGNWALFERPDQEALAVPLGQEPIDADVPDFREALRRHRLELEGGETATSPGDKTKPPGMLPP